MTAKPHYIYRCFDSAGRLLYVGCTQDLTARMRVHAAERGNPASAELVKRLAVVEYEEHPDRATALAAEKAAIEAEAPLINTHHNLGRGMRDLPRFERQAVSASQRAQFDAVLARFGGAA